MRKHPVCYISMDIFKSGSYFKTEEFYVMINKTILVFLSIFITLILCGCEKKTDKYSKFNSISKIENFDLNENKTFYSALHEGENVLLFWASWCPHCENTISFILDHKQSFEKILTVSVDEEPNNTKIHEGDFPIYLDHDQKIFQSVSGEYIPSVFIIDDAGNVLGSSQGEEDSKKLLEEYIKNHE